MSIKIPEKLRYEYSLWQTGVIRIAGVDEAGRGPLAGPVVAAAVIFPPGEMIAEVDDSKKLPPQERLQLYPTLIERCVAYGVGVVTAEEIDRINILQASLLAMCKAIAALEVPPDHVLIDGRSRLALELPQTTIVKGDGMSFTIGAASIIAKVVRDRIMQHYHLQFPGYGFNAHKGYPTRSHLAALKRLGPCAIHRRSFRPRELEATTERSALKRLKRNSSRHKNLDFREY